MRVSTNIFLLMIILLYVFYILNNIELKRIFSFMLLVNFENINYVYI